MAADGGQRSSTNNIREDKYFMFSFFFSCSYPPHFYFNFFLILELLFVNIPPFYASCSFSLPPLSCVEGSSPPSSTNSNKKLYRRCPYKMKVRYNHRVPRYQFHRKNIRLWFVIVEAVVGRMTGIRLEGETRKNDRREGVCTVFYLPTHFCTWRGEVDEWQ